MKILIVVNVDWYFWSHRLPLAKALRREGHEVVVVAAEERGFRPRIENEGFRFIPLRLRRGSTNPLRELATWLDFLRVYRREHPDAIHQVSIKPILYGSIAARLAGRPAIVNAVTGLGYAFLPDVRRSALGKITRLLYRIACGGSRTFVICQNPDDRDALAGLGVAPERIRLIRGSGVDVQQFVPTPEPHGSPVVLMSGRLLWDKGVGDFVEAARLLRAAHVDVRPVLVGIPDEENPNSVPQDQVQRWHNEGLIEWWGLREDMPYVIAQASIVVLPSYYPEGVPRILIEAAAAGRPIVATDVPGCREIARPGTNAEVVAPRDPVGLAAAIRRLLDDPAKRTAYGAAGRRLAVDEFSEDRVLNETLELYRRVQQGAAVA